jgi:hypothetical protein
VPGNVPSGVPQFVDLLFQSRARATGGGGFGRAAVHRFDLDIECIDPPLDPTADGPGIVFHPQVQIERLAMSSRVPSQGDDIATPPGFTATFVEVDADATPTALAASAGHGFGQTLHLTHRINPLPAFADSAPADTSEVLRYDGNTFSSLAGATLHGPSDLTFDASGEFGLALYAAGASAFDAESGAPLPGSGVIRRVETDGATSTLVGGLHSPSGLAFPAGVAWDRALYTTQVGSGDIVRVQNTGVTSTFATGLGRPIDLVFGTGPYGDDLYAAEADTVPPDSVPHAYAGRISRLETNGTRTTFTSALNLPTALAWGDPDGPFGDYLYVALWNTLDSESLPVEASGRVVRIDAAGIVTPFLEGLESPVRLAFVPPGDLYVAVAGGLVHVTASGTTDSHVDLVSTGPRLPLLLEAAPNPFNPTTVVRFEAPEAMHLRLELFDAGGRLVRTLADGRFTAGPHRVIWDGTDRHGKRLSSGVYVARLRGDNGRTAVRRLVLVR